MLPIRPQLLVIFESGHRDIGQLGHWPQQPAIGNLVSSTCSFNPTGPNAVREMLVPHPGVPSFLCWMTSRRQCRSRALPHVGHIPYRRYRTGLGIAVCTSAVEVKKTRVKRVAEKSIFFACSASVFLRLWPAAGKKRGEGCAILTDRFSYEPTKIHQQNDPAAVRLCGAVVIDRHRHTPLAHSTITVVSQHHSGLFTIALLWCWKECDWPEFS